jgi:hypothetical protein
MKLLSAALLILATATIMLVDPATAQLHHDCTGQSFTAAEQNTIERNKALKLLVETDPCIVRRALDVLAAIAAPAAGGTTAPEQRSRGIGPRDPTATPDPIENPDLNRLQMASPEAAYDLFQLLKQASSRKSHTQ